MKTFFPLLTLAVLVVACNSAILPNGSRLNVGGVRPGDALLQRAPSTAFYYFAWRLAEEARRERRELSGISQRVFFERTPKIPWIYRNLNLKKGSLCLVVYATGSYQRLVGMGKHLGQTSVSKCVTQVTEALNDPSITDTFIKFPTSRTERDAIKQK
ncbi:unnamed protein product, partial [Brenthis ino]